MAAAAKLLDLGDDFRGLGPGGVVVGGVADGAGAEDPDGDVAEGLAVLLEEVAGVAAPALHIDGAAEDDGVVGVEALHVSARSRQTLRPSRRSLAATVSAISSVEPRLEA